MSQNTINTILDKAKLFASAAGKKTEEVVEASKLKLQIMSLNGDISRAYEEIGSLVYHAKKQGKDEEEAIQDKMQEIDQLLAKLQSMESKMTEIKKIRKCSNCGATCPADAHFCSRCGMILSAMIAPAGGQEIVDAECQDVVESAEETEATHNEEPHNEEPHDEEPHSEEPHSEEPHSEVPHSEVPHNETEQKEQN